MGKYRYAAMKLYNFGERRVMRKFNTPPGYKINCRRVTLRLNGVARNKSSAVLGLVCIYLLTDRMQLN